MDICGTCKRLKLSIETADNLAVKRTLSLKLLDHKLSAHPLEGGLPWQSMPKHSPMIASIVDRDN